MLLDQRIVLALRSEAMKVVGKAARFIIDIFARSR
jgi:hypothetical protein